MEDGGGGGGIDKMEEDWGKMGVNGGNGEYERYGGG